MSASRLWRELLAGYSVTDVVSMALCDGHGCWGFLDLWRTTGPFSSGECAKLETIAGIVTGALRRSLLPTFTFESTGPVTRGGPAVLLFSEDIEVLTQTPHTDTYLRALLPTGADHTPIPAAAYNVAAQLLATEHGVDPHPASTRIPLGNGHWVTLRAARINETPSVAASIAVTIEPTPPTERTELFCRISGLTQRESDVLRCLVDGSTTRTVAQRMSISDHTVQDHLKAIFAKTGATSRRVLTARATGAT